jgi:hypothetical protein
MSVRTTNEYLRRVGNLSEQPPSSGVVEYILINVTILLVADMILIIVYHFVDLPRLALLAPLCLTATSAALLFIALLRLRKQLQQPRTTH